MMPAPGRSALERGSFRLGVKGPWRFRERCRAQARSCRGFVLLLWFAAFGAHATDVRRFEGETMGTTWSVNAVLPAKADEPAIERGIQAQVDRVVAQMSTYEPDSDLSRFNRAPAGTWHALPPQLYTVLSYALSLAKDSGGAYDPTVGPLVNLWGFGPDKHPHEAPDAATIAAARPHRACPRVTRIEQDRWIIP